MNDPFDSIFNDESTKPKSNWFKFEKVGDKIAGLVVDFQDREAQGVYGPQRIFTLRKSSGDEVLVPIKKDNDYLMQRVKYVRKGDVIGFEFTKEIEAKQKGHHPAKAIEPRVKYTVEGDAERALEGIAARVI